VAVTAEPVKTWVALLRGINVGGKNRLPMTGRNWRTMCKIRELLTGGDR
jgi:uncharacterized protein (DUF1697 family)